MQANTINSKLTIIDKTQDTVQAKARPQPKNEVIIAMLKADKDDITSTDTTKTNG